MSPKRILIFSLAYHPMVGGAEIAVKEITDRITDIEFDMITMRFNAVHPEKEQIGNCMVYRINTSKNFFPFRAFLFAKKLHSDRPYDATWAIMANWAGFAALFFKFRFPQVPFILTLQEGDPIPYIKRRVWFVYPLFKKIFTRADIIQAISTYLADWAKNMGYRGQVEVIPNGVDVEKFRPTANNNQPTTNTVLITTSRLAEKNAVGDIIKALKFLPNDVILKIIGTGPLEFELKELARITGQGSRVKFLGHIPHYDISKYLHEADIFVRPSLSEGMGNSFIEAMAAGLPVIATPVGGIPDFLQDGKTGLFCEVNNPKSIADKVMEYINNPELTTRIVENANKMVRERYDWNLVAREMKERVFDKV
ncbi:MAG: Glycosyltransferase [Candidatus Gottesmanbacteria bacterium GW2011_GWA2_47_9]|uniref:Glycosyltransferase n=1 Tax=Candidatus Gottesmanbacteria bacterium GW2011_GWA2_47_9 TaxID=1618445 RepID=A0A0G1TZG6_9BACT|nr:MAG: Glycosyltransferase [Candidatus Gottesmanbacteria bacterium GW2011_GWA2_47_9]